MIQKSYEKNKFGNLYLVPTPIGNLEDITFRALNILKEVDIVYAEDTRETYNLLKYYKIDKRIESCHKYTEMKHKDKIVNILKNGKNIAYVTDRGTPLISDPGNIIVDECIKNDINVISLPGPNALLPALNMSGISNEKFLFFGFLNNKKELARKQLIQLKSINVPIIFYESPYRLKNTVQLLYDVLGNRKAAIIREISKIHEEVIRGSLLELLDMCDNIKGEIVIIVEGNKEIKTINIDYKKLVDEYVKNGMSTRDAVKKISLEYNINKNKVYNEVKEQ